MLSLFFLLSLCRALYDTDVIQIDGCRNYLFLFSVGDEGILEYSTTDTIHQNDVQLALCRKGEDYSVSSSMTDKDKCEYLQSMCDICLFLLLLLLYGKLSIR